MNKILPLFMFFTLISSNLSSQTKKALSIHYGIIQSELIRTASLAGGGGFSNKKSYEVGLRFYQPISDRISFESGIDFFSTIVEISSDFPGVEIREESLDMISFPLLMHFSVNENYFLNTGILVNIQSDEASFDKQTGIGFTFGLGRKFFVNEFYFLLNPKIDINAVVPFSKQKNQQRLIEFGLQIGIGYQF